MNHIKVLRDKLRFKFLYPSSNGAQNHLVYLLLHCLAGKGR